MARLVGGIFSTASGHNNGLVFGKALTKDGKKTTVRQYVKPTNPNTTAQQNQRGRFANALEVVKGWGRGYYAAAYKGAIGGLAGFQSLMSLVTNAMSSDGSTLGALEEISLGTLHAPDTVSGAIASGTLTVTFSTENGANGNPNDKIIVAVADTAEPSPGTEWPTTVDSSAVRSDGTVAITLDSNNSGAASFVVYAQNGAASFPSEQKYSAMVTSTA